MAREKCQKKTRELYPFAILRQAESSVASRSMQSQAMTPTFPVPRPSCAAAHVPSASGCWRPYLCTRKISRKLPKTRMKGICSGAIFGVGFGEGRRFKRTPSGTRLPARRGQATFSLAVSDSGDSARTCSWSRPCFLAVARTLRRVENFSAPACERKPPDTSALSFIMRRSRTASLLAEGTPGSRRNPGTSAFRSRSLGARLWPFRRGGRAWRALKLSPSGSASPQPGRDSGRRSTTESGVSDFPASAPRGRTSRAGCRSAFSFSSPPPSASTARRWTGAYRRSSCPGPRFARARGSAPAAPSSRPSTPRFRALARRPAPRLRDDAAQKGDLSLRASRSFRSRRPPRRGIQSQSAPWRGVKNSHHRDCSPPRAFGACFA